MIYHLEWENRNQKEMRAEEIIILHTRVNGNSDLRFKKHPFFIFLTNFTDFFFFFFFFFHFRLSKVFLSCGGLLEILNGENGDIRFSNLSRNRHVRIMVMRAFVVSISIVLKNLMICQGIFSFSFFSLITTVTC